MNCYDPGTPRLAFGIAAIAMTAATFGLLVVLPSKMESDRNEYFALAAVSAALSAPCDAVFNPVCADALAGESPDAVLAPVRNSEPKCGQAG